MNIHEYSFLNFMYICFIIQDFLKDKLDRIILGYGLFEQYFHSIKNYMDLSLRKEALVMHLGAIKTLLLLFTVPFRIECIRFMDSFPISSRSWITIFR